MSNHLNEQSEFSGLLEFPDKITPEDVRHFRREVFGDGIVSRSEAAAVFAINNAVANKCEEWGDFFVEALADHLVNQAEPRGYVTVENAEWLISMVSHDGRVRAATELELLINVLMKSKHSPECLVGYILEEIGRVVLEGEGPLASGRELTPGAIGEAEVELMRQVLFAYGGDDGISISKREAEFLFLMNDRTDEARNHSAWRELYVKAISNYLMAAATCTAPSRMEAVAREEWLADTSVDIGSTLSRALSGFGDIFSRRFLESLFADAHTQIERAWRERNRRQIADQTEAERITGEEAHWLVEKLLADGVVSESERSLLGYLRTQSPDVDPDLSAVIDNHAAEG